MFNFIFIALSEEMTNTIIKKSVGKSNFGNFNPAQIGESLNKYLNSMVDYLLPFFILFAFFIAVGYLIFSHQNAGKRIINATIGAIIALSSFGFLKTVYDKIDQNSKPNDFFGLMNAIFSYIKELFEGIQAIAFMIAFFVAAFYIMFSHSSGWKRMVNATLGIILSFLSVLIVNVIIKQFNTL